MWKKLSILTVTSFSLLALVTATSSFAGGSYGGSRGFDSDHSRGFSHSKGKNRSYYHEDNKSKKYSQKQKSPSSTKPVNINTASKEQLMTLPGIGTVEADAIIAAREKHGKLKSADDLTNVENLSEQATTIILSHIEY